MLDSAFFELSPRPYISTPHATEQYGHVLRTSVARASLYWRTSARTGVGEKPTRARLDTASVAPVTLRNWRRVTSMTFSEWQWGTSGWIRCSRSSRRFLVEVYACR